jgi:hypothetical protein
MKAARSLGCDDGPAHFRWRTISYDCVGRAGESCVAPEKGILAKKRLSDNPKPHRTRAIQEKLSPTPTASIPNKIIATELSHGESQKPR